MHIDHYKTTDPKGTVFMFHGIGTNGRLMSFLAVRLCKAGYEVVCPDFPYFGCTVQEGTVSYEDWRDIALYTVKSYRRDSLPVFVFGIGIGGTLAYECAYELGNIPGIMATGYPDFSKEETFHALFGSEQAYRETADYLRKWQWLLPAKKMRLSDLFDLSGIVQDEKAGAILREDEHAGNAVVQLRFVHSLLRHEMRVPPGNYRSGAALWIKTGKDTWMNEEIAEGLYGAMGCRKEILELRDAGHLPIEAEMTDRLTDGLIGFMESCL